MTTMTKDNKNKVLNVPTLRFPEFSGEWEKCKLGEIVIRITRKNRNNESKLPLTISAQYGLVDQISFFNKIVASSDMSNYYLLYNGEFAYNKSYSGDYPWGAIKRLNKYDKGALSSLYICFAPKDNIESNFLVHYFESSKWNKEVSNIAGEGARNHGLLNISVEDFFNTKHWITLNYNEQKKIGNFLNLITERIETQKKIIEDLKKLKKEISKRIFSKQINFSKQKFLGDICTITTGKLDANAMTKNGKYLFFTCAYENYKTDTYAFEGKALLISGNGEVGLVKKYNGKFNAYQRTYVLQNFIENMDYIKCYIEYFLPKRIQKEKNVGAMPYIVLSTLYDMNIAIPSIETQNQISKIIDTIINFIECEYDIQAKYELQKQFLLRRMFI